MRNLTEEVFDLANDILNSKFEVSHFDALQIATKIQSNRVLTDAFMLDTKDPSALESIAMELGASKNGTSIKSALYNLKDETV
jgi:hypothetical protein